MRADVRAGMLFFSNILAKVLVGEGLGGLDVFILLKSI